MNPVTLFAISKLLYRIDKSLRRIADTVDPPFAKDDGVEPELMETDDEKFAEDEYRELLRQGGYN